jgi:phosphatidylserine decarboxylase precursor
VHAPVDGEVTWSCHIPGAFWPVNAWGVRQVPKLFCVNERVVTLLQTPQGYVAVVMIAAMHVGQITLAYDTSITTTKRAPRRPSTETVYTPPRPLTKGAELGIFHMGSTVLVLFAPGVLSIEVGPLCGRRVHMGRVAAHVRLTRLRSTWAGAAGRWQPHQWTKTDTPPGPDAREAGSGCS